jgi:hypothetical protein
MDAMDTGARPGEDLTVDVAIEKLSQSLRDAEYAIPVTHGRTFTWRRCAFQAHASPAQFPRDVQYVVDKLASEKPWRHGRYTPCGELEPPPPAHAHTHHHTRTKYTRTPHTTHTYR